MDLLIVPLHGWNGRAPKGWVRRDTQIMRRVARRPEVGHVLVVERPTAPAVALWDYAGGRGRERPRQVVARWGGATLTKVAEKVTLLDVFMPDPIAPLYLGRGWWPRALGSDRLGRAVRWALGYIGIGRYCFYSFVPFAHRLAQQIRPQAVVFDALDNWATHEGMKPYREAAIEGYEWWRGHADVVICGSEGTEEMLAGARRLARVPNGVDLAHFTRTRVVAADVAAVPAPRVGYAGLMDTRVDIDLLAAVAAILPGVHFILVGPAAGRKTRAAVSLLTASRGNVRWLGPQAYASMPAVISGFDVGIIPHRVNAYTRGMNPLKLYEYLACGVPVVTTAVGGLQELRGAVCIADGADEFAAGIAHALCNQRDGQSARRPADGAELRGAVAGMSWDARVTEILSEVCVATGDAGLFAASQRGNESV